MTVTLIQEQQEHLIEMLETQEEELKIQILQGRDHLLPMMGRMQTVMVVHQIMMVSMVVAQTSQLGVTFLLEEL